MQQEEQEHTSILMQSTPSNESYTAYALNNEKSTQTTPPSSPSVRQGEEAPPSRLAVLGAVSFYMIAALVMVSMILQPIRVYLMRRIGGTDLCE